MTANTPYKILVVDDEKVIRNFLARFLGTMSLEVKTAEDGLAAIEAVKKEVFDVVFIDVRMPGMSGLEAFAQMKRLCPSIVCVFMTGYAMKEVLPDAIKPAHTFCVEKPFESLNHLREMVNKSLEEAKLCKSEKQEST